MKTYVGLPPADPADKNSQPVVTSVDSVTGVTVMLSPVAGGAFSWGRNGIYHGNLARAILTDFFPTEPDLVTKLYLRFGMRKLLTLPSSRPDPDPVTRIRPPGAPFQLSGAEVAAAVQAIIENEEGMDAIRAQIALQSAPVVSDALPGLDAEGKPMAIEEKG